MVAPRGNESSVEYLVRVRYADIAVENWEPLDLIEHCAGPQFAQLLDDYKSRRGPPDAHSKRDYEVMRR
jgi:hypothetical protein